jgi:hypothetical protein
LWPCNTNPVGGCVLGEDGSPLRFKNLDFCFDFSLECPCLETEKIGTFTWTAVRKLKL